MIFAYENGKVAKVEMSAYYTKTNRKKLIKASCEKYGLADALYLPEDTELVLRSSGGRLLLLHTGLLTAKTTKNTQGVSIMRLKKGQRVEEARLYQEGEFAKPSRYRTKSLPALGAFPASEDVAGEQLTLDTVTD